MGLDIIEMIMDIEEAFDIKIPDEAAERIRTVGECHLYVLGRIQERISKRPADEKPRPAKCVSSHVFYRFRRAFQRVCGVTKADVRLDRPLKDILPGTNRRKIWQTLQVETGLPLPGLVRSGHLTTAMCGSAVVAFLAMMLPVSRSLFGPQNIAWAACLSAAVATWLSLMLITLPLRICLPKNCITVRNMVLGVIARNYGKILPEEGGDIWPLIREIVIRYAYVPPEKVTPEARFIQDLGMG